MRLILATNNAHKVREFKQILEPMGFEVVSQRDAGYIIEVEETGTTFEENSYLKAQAVTEASGLPAIADDSGIMADALGGAPGVYSARYTGNDEDTDEDRMYFLLKNMENETDRAAKFVSCITCTFPDGTVIAARGECHGTLTHEPRGENGFGYDPIFLPNGYDRTTAELSPDEKNAISHRGQALRIFKTKLEEYLNK